MEEVYLDIHHQPYRLSQTTGRPEALGREHPQILYLKIRGNKIRYAVCPIHFLEEPKSIPINPIKSEMIYNFPTMIPAVDAIIADVAPTALNMMIGFRKRLLQIKKLKNIPFIMLESALPETIMNRRDFRQYVDDIVSREIETADLEKKIALLKKIKHTHEVIAQVVPEAVEWKASTAKNKMGAGGYVKRLLDILAAIGLLILFSPLMLMIALLVKLTSKGPVFYAAERSGHNYKVFKFMKFRTMQVDADKRLSSMQDLNQYGAQKKNNPVFFKIKDDPRITPLGKVLRNTSLDELPQLFNVLKGDMSLVGNRPLPLYEAKLLTTDQCVERFNAPAGITGLWQVKKRGEREVSAEERIALDIEYAKCYSLKKDMGILLATPKALIQKDNV